MLTANNNLAKARKTNGETVLQVLARNPSAFVSETRPCEFFIYFLLYFFMSYFDRNSP